MEPAPSPAESFIDPFDPLPDDFPPAPDWLLPATLALFSVVAIGITVLLVMWGISRKKSAASLAAMKAGAPAWVDLRDFDPKADPRRPKSPKVVREKPLSPNAKNKGKKA